MTANSGNTEETFTRELFKRCAECNFLKIDSHVGVQQDPAWCQVCCCKQHYKEQTWLLSASKISLPAYLSVPLSLSLLPLLSAYLFLLPTIPVHLSACLLVCLALSLSLYIPPPPPTTTSLLSFLSACLFLLPIIPVHLSLSLSVSPSISPCLYLSLCLSLSLSYDFCLSKSFSFPSFLSPCQSVPPAPSLSFCLYLFVWLFEKFVEKSNVKHNFQVWDFPVQPCWKVDQEERHRWWKPSRLCIHRGDFWCHQACSYCHRPWGSWPYD